jgi:hypothetical protein
MGITAPLKIGYSDGSGVDTLCITDAHDNLVVWGRTGLDPGVSGVKSEFEAAQLIYRFNAHDALVRALEFYADPKRYDGPNQHPLPDDPYARPDAAYIYDVTRDHGAVARAALRLAKAGAPASTNEEAA